MKREADEGVRNRARGGGIAIFLTFWAAPVQRSSSRSRRGLVEMPVHHLLIDPPSSSCLPDPYFPISTVVGLGLVLAWPIARKHLLFMFYVFKY